MFSIDIKRSSMKTIDGIVITLNDRSLRFNGKASIRLEKVLSKDKDKKKDEKEANLFDCFNDYVESHFSTDRRLELYRIYEKAYAIAENVRIGDFDYNVEIAELSPIVTQLLDFINIPRYCDYITYSPHMQIPADLSVAASKGDYPAETTITDRDYVELVKLAFVCRVAYPIVFSLLARYGSRMGSEHAQLVVGKLLKNNPQITSMPGFIKLRGYVQFAFGKRGIPSQVDQVGSNEYFIEKVLFNTIFDRLCCGVIPETEEGKNLATAINSSVKAHETGGGQLKKKDFSGEDDEDKRSMYERFQASEAVKSVLEVEQAEYGSFGLYDETDAERHVDRFKYQCLGLKIKNEKLVEAVYDRIPPNWEFTLEDHMLRLLELTFGHDISSQSFMSFKYRQLMAIIALGQVRLAEWGFTYLPSVLGAIHDPNGMRSLSSGFELNPEDKNYLTSICSIQSANNDGRSFNEAVVAATEFLEKFRNGIWQSNLEYGVLDNPEIYERVHKAALFPLEIDIEIKNEFMQLVRKYNE